MFCLVLGQIIEITWLTCVEASIQVPHGLAFNREKAQSVTLRLHLPVAKAFEGAARIQMLDDRDSTRLMLVLKVASDHVSG